VKFSNYEKVDMDISNDATYITFSESNKVSTYTNEAMTAAIMLKILIYSEN